MVEYVAIYNIYMLVHGHYIFYINLCYYTQCNLQPRNILLLGSLDMHGTCVPIQLYNVLVWLLAEMF